VVTISELNIYPLKSGRRISKTSVRLVATGLEWDRHWMITNCAGTFLTQRTHPCMARIETEIADETVTFRAPGPDKLTLPLRPTGAPSSVQVWKDRCEALDQGDAAGHWASAAIGEAARLVRVPAAAKRMANPEFAGPAPIPVAFSDGFPILVCNRSSLDDLNMRMPEPVPMERFRPNIVLDGLPPFAEDHIAAIAIGPARLRLVKPCTRCIITSTDQLTGERSTNPLPVLREFRFNRSLLGVTFGENAVPSEGVGSIIERGAQCQVEYR